MGASGRYANTANKTSEDCLGLPRTNPTKIESNSSQIQPKSDQIESKSSQLQPKSNQNQCKSSQNQIQIKIKIESSFKMLVKIYKSYRNPINPMKIIGNPRKILGSSWWRPRSLRSAGASASQPRPGSWWRGSPVPLPLPHGPPLREAPGKEAVKPCLGKIPSKIPRKFSRATRGFRGASCWAYAYR